jgi:hypothetical protein
MRNLIFAINITLDGCCDHAPLHRRSLLRQPHLSHPAFAQYAQQRVRPY